MEDLKNKINAILFAVGKKIEVDKISSLCSIQDKSKIRTALKEIQEDYAKDSSSVILANEGDCWKLTVRESYLPLVRNIVTDTEMSKSVTETLATIAFKYPLTQAELVKIRSNKAYDHVKELQQMQFIEKSKSGRTYDIKLTQKFFEYFDLPEEELKQKFRSYKKTEQEIEEKEKEYEEKRKEIEKANKELQEKLNEKQQNEDDYMAELDKMAPTESSQKLDIEEGKNA